MATTRSTVEFPRVKVVGPPQGRAVASAETLHKRWPAVANTNFLMEKQMPQMTEAKDLLKHELGDLLYAERRFLTATKRLARETSDPEIKQRIEQHVEETEQQIQRLENAFESIGEKAKAEKCEAAIGLREEHDSFKSEEKPSKVILEAFDLGSGLRVEHYEIAGYRSAITLAKALGHTECAQILQQSLAEEEDMANFLETNAPKALQRLLAQL